MNKIITALKYFQDQTNSKNSTTQQIADKASGKENEKGSNRESESRPRTSRGKRKARKKSGNGGNSALGFHSNVHNHSLIHNIEGMKNPHNRSVNIAVDSPRSKKRKAQKGRVSPNTFAIYHQRHPSGLVNHHKNTSLEQERLANICKSRPKSAKLKKKCPKTGERSKKGSSNRQGNQSFVKSGFHHNFVDASLIEDESFDRDEKSLKFMKKHAGIKKMSAKLKNAEAKRQSNSK